LEVYLLRKKKVPNSLSGENYFFKVSRPGLKNPDNVGPPPLILFNLLPLYYSTSSPDIIQPPPLILFNLLP